MAQNWTNAIDYIKQNLGVPINDIELTDDELINYLKEHVLPEFSIYSPHFKWVQITNAATVDVPNNFNNFTYRIPIPVGYEISDVRQVYFQDEGIFDFNFSTFLVDPRDIVMSSVLSDLLDSLQVTQSFQFLKPDILRFDEPLTGQLTIAELEVVHNSPETIDTDLYRIVFKKWCLAEIIGLLIARRSKFENLTTPFGSLNLNVNKLEQQYQDLKSKLQIDLDNIPPKHLVDWFI